MIVTFPSNSFKEYQYVWITFSVHNFLCTNQWIHSSSSKAIEHVAWQVFWLVSVNKRLPNRLRSLSVAWGSVHHAFMKHTATGLFRIYTWFPFNPYHLIWSYETDPKTKLDKKSIACISFPSYFFTLTLPSEVFHIIHEKLKKIYTFGQH